jgi:hypothetical protein
MSFTCLVERFPPPTEDEYLRALLHEPLGDGEPDAAVAAADNGDFAFQSRHDAAFSLRPGSSGQGLRFFSQFDVGSPAPGAQCGSSHTGGAQTIRPNAWRGVCRAAFAVREKGLELRWPAMLAKYVAARLWTTRARDGRLGARLATASQ